MRISARGFTLIEAAITTFLLLTALACVVNAFTFGSLQTARALEETVAITLAAGKLEDLRAAPQLSPGHYFEDLPAATLGRVSSANTSGYLRTWDITALPGNTTQISVVVYGRLTARGLPYELARNTTLVGSRF